MIGPSKSDSLLNCTPAMERTLLPRSSSSSSRYTYSEPTKRVNQILLGMMGRGEKVDGGTAEGAATVGPSRRIADMFGGGCDGEGGCGCG